MLRNDLIAAVIGGSLIASAPVAYAQQDGRNLLQQLDQDHDNTLSWDEVQGAIHAGFAALDTDQDNTLDRKEAARAGIKASTLRAADPDRDGTLDENEYTKLARQRFDAADRDHDGTVSRRELDSTAAGHALVRMLQVRSPKKPE